MQRRSQPRQCRFRTPTESILEFIKANPGTHLRKIKREVNLAMGVTQYHLYKLEREHRLLSVRHGLYKRFYADKRPRSARLRELERLNL